MKYPIGKNAFEIQIRGPEGSISVQQYNWVAVTNEGIRVHNDWDAITTDDSHEFFMPMDASLRNMLEQPAIY